MIHVFDALGTFTADTSQLDQFTIKLEQGLTGASHKAAAATVALKAAQDEFRASIAAVNAEGGKTTENMMRLADAEQQLALAAAAARQEHAALKSSLTDAGVAAEKTAVSMHEARGEAMLLGEAFGIHLPRHVTSFLASIPGISEALSAAFSATAVLFLIDAVVKGAEKLSDWVAETFIFTDAMKKETATIAETNKAILEQIDLYKRAEEVIKEFGLTGSTLTKSRMDELTDAINKNKDALRNAENQLYGLRNGFVDLVGDAGQFENKVNQLTSAIKTQNEQMDLLQRQHDQEQTDEIIRAENERISAAKTASSARISVSESEALLRLAITGGNYSQILAVQNKGNEEQLRNDVRAMSERIAALAFEGDHTKGERQKLSADIEKLIDDHNNKVRAIYAKAWEDIRQIGKTPIPFITEVPPGMETITNAITQGFDQAKQAAEALGITLKTDLASGLSAAFASYDKLVQLQKLGIVTQRDVDEGYKSLIKTELDYAIQTGASAEAVKKLQNELRALLQAELAQLRASHASVQQIQRVQKELKKLQEDQNDANLSIRQSGPILQAYQNELAQTGNVAMSVAAGLSQAIALTTEAFASGSETMVAAIAKIAQAEVAAIAGIADKKGAEQLAEAFGSYPDFSGMAHHFTSATLWFALGGAIAAIGGQLGGVGSTSGNVGSSAKGTSGPASTSPNVNAQSGPSPVINTTHFAAGGIATQPMLAMVGDSASGGAAEEAIIPLHDNDAITKIASAILAPIQRLAHLNPNLSIPASIIYPDSGSSVRGPQSSGSGLSRQDVQQVVEAIKAVHAGANSGVTINIEGLVSDDNVDKLMQKMTHRVHTNRSRLLASDSIRHTKRS